ncbi:MAG: nickel pincer cofactor biosynthesis protein LarC [Acidimicrobiales bacterium]
MTRLAWWHCFSGIAGDMALASLVDAGADLAQVRADLTALPLRGWSIEATPVLRAGLAATRIDVHATDTGEVRTHAGIAGLVGQARLPARARRRALATFSALAEAEGRLHRRPPGQVHFHEVGGIDAIVDVVGTCLALDLLEIDEVHASPVALGSGTTTSAHGHLPVPTPAVVELLAGAPTYGGQIPRELTTPTGAALLAALVSGWGPMPEITIQSSGWGAGAADLDGVPNALPVVIGQPTALPDPTGTGGGQPVVLLETNLDDVTGEILAGAISALMAAGAHDAWLTPVLGKKGRPAHVLSALADPSAAAALRRLMVAETGTLGVRGRALTRWVARREMGEVDVGGQPVRVKLSAGRVKAEHEDASRAARALGLPAREVARRAEQLAQPHGGDSDR